MTIHEHLRLHARRGSVQAQYMPLREVAGDVLCLAADGDLEARFYRSVLEVTSTNHTLRSGDEQESIVATYRDFLKALEFPLQILVRSQRLDLTPYLTRLSEAVPAPARTIREHRIQELASSPYAFCPRN